MRVSIALELVHLGRDPQYLLVDLKPLRENALHPFSLASLWPSFKPLKHGVLQSSETSLFFELCQHFLGVSITRENRQQAGQFTLGTL